MTATIKQIQEQLAKMEKDAVDECHAYAIRFAKFSEPEHRLRALTLEVKVGTIKRIQEFIRKGK